MDQLMTCPYCEMLLEPWEPMVTIIDIVYHLECWQRRPRFTEAPDGRFIRVDAVQDKEAA